jgi:hypothetical protein
MIKYAFLLLLSAALWLFVGYYDSIEDAEIHSNFFIKKKPTLQVKFFNMFANDADPKSLSQLTPQQRQRVIDYCHYRLGILTRLETEEDLTACMRR